MCCRIELRNREGEVGPFLLPAVAPPTSSAIWTLASLFLPGFPSFVSGIDSSVYLGTLCVGLLRVGAPGDGKCRTMWLCCSRDVAGQVLGWGLGAAEGSPGGFLRKRRHKQGHLCAARRASWESSSPGSRGPLRVWEPGRRPQARPSSLV